MDVKLIPEFALRSIFFLVFPPQTDSICFVRADAAITKFLNKASMRIKAYQPKCIISAAVKPNLFNARNTFGQEWDVWLASGYIDWAVPMNYSNENRKFESNLKIIQDGSRRRREHLNTGIFSTRRW